MKQLDDVIAAIATPIGEGGISVIRISGKNAIEVTDKGFRGRQPLTLATTHTAHFGSYVDHDGNIIDEVVATVFRAPHSYTAEDVIEVSCHGGFLVTKKILESIINYGARVAEPGEFTKRAFLNGRIDLSQAEAVADIIHSRSDLAHRASISQLNGNLSSKITEIRNRIMNACSLMELELDFAEEGIEFTDRHNLEEDITNMIREIDQLIDSFQYGKVYREGVKVVLAGRPNVGKSSLLNALLNEERAIVTHISGTTRDIIEENISINGLLFRLTDTAGLRESSDLIEREGIRLAEHTLKEADIILFLVDAADGFIEDDCQNLHRIMDFPNCTSRKIIIVWNKIDLLKDKDSFGFHTPVEFEDHRRVSTSGKVGTGINKLKDALYDSVFEHPISRAEQSIIVTNERHRDGLERSKRSLELALIGIQEKKSTEFIAIDLRSALNSLGEIVGLVTTDDILNNIFSKFCIGK